MLSEWENPNAKHAVHTVFHHDSEKFDDYFRARSDENLSLATLLCVVDRLQSVVQHVHSHHGVEVLGLLS